MNDNKIGELRPSQLITTFGPGAIMDLPDLSVIIAGLDDWNEDLCERIDEPRLTKKLKLKQILTPPLPLNNGSEGQFTGTLPAYKFHKYMVCPNCRKLRHERHFNGDPRNGITYCLCEKDTKTRVFPSRFIVVCPAGHIDDFPWHKYVHAENKKYDCKGDLVLNDNGASGSIADVEVKCTSCGDKRSLKDAFSKKRTDVLGTCKGRRPWLGKGGDEECEHPLRASLRGASNVYFSLIASSIRIPDTKNKIYKTIEKDYANNVSKIDSLETLNMLMDQYGQLSELQDFDRRKVFEEIKKYNNRSNKDEGDLLGPEYEAMLSGNYVHPGYDFEVETQPVPESFSGLIENLVMVRRLTEVRALVGFTRIDSPPDISALMSKDTETRSASETASLSREYKNWRPGIVTRGEGIFLTLCLDKVKEWEEKKDVQEAGVKMAAAYGKFCADRDIKDSDFPGARYVLLHSLSHMLMRQLCLGSGYSSSALRERIYSRSEDGKEMAGILIYTATPDSEGSLGGLVELGQTHEFEKILNAALQEARFCSGDPLCSEHAPGTVGDVNGAACHACQLTAETSCERSNRFLDRNFLVPTISYSDLAFFK